MDGSSYFVGGSATVENCLDVKVERSCKTALVLAKFDETGALDETFGNDEGVTMVPRVHCELGESSDVSPTLPTRGLCRQPMSSKLRPQINVIGARTGQPAIKAKLGPVSAVDGSSVRWSLTINLARALRPRRGILAHGFRFRSGKRRIALSGRPTRKRKSKFKIEIADSELRAGKPLRVTVRRGYLRRVPERKLGSKLRFGFRLIRSGTSYDDGWGDKLAEAEQIGSAVAFDRLPSKKRRGR